MFADRLKYAMRIRGIKSINLAEKLNIDRGAISRYLSGKIAPRTDRIHEIAIALDVQEAWLLGFDVPMERSVMRAKPLTEEIQSIISQLTVDNQQMALNMIRTIYDTQKAQESLNKKSV